MRDVSAIKHRIYGVAARGIPFIREDIIAEGNRDQIKEAFDHENRELIDAAHDDIRRNQYQGFLRGLIRQLSDKDKITDLNKIGPEFSGKLRTFSEYLASLGGEADRYQEWELFAMWPLYLSEINQTFAEATNFRNAYREFYDAHARHLTESEVRQRSVKSYVPIIRRPFSNVGEVKALVDVDTEWSIDVLPEPDNWQGPSLYGFILSVVDGQLHMGFYDFNGVMREVYTDEKTETALRAIGLIGNEGLVVLVRSSFQEQLSGHAVPGVGGRISLGGHSHPRGSGVTPSESRSLGSPADVELFALSLSGLPEGYPVNKYIPAFARRKGAKAGQGTKKQKDRKAETASNIPSKDNLMTILGGAIKQLEVFAKSRKGAESQLPIDELILYLKVLRAMYEETVGQWEGTGADDEYMHRYKAEFAGELAHHPAFQADAQRMLDESLEGAFRVLAQQIPDAFFDEPGSLNRMVSVVNQVIVESLAHLALREMAIALINDPRTYGLGDIDLTETGSTKADLVKKIRGWVETAKRRIAGEGAIETSHAEGTKPKAPADYSSHFSIDDRTQQLGSVSDVLFNKAGKIGEEEMQYGLKPRLEDVVRQRANRLLILADKAVNDDPELAEAALREYLRLVKMFGKKAQCFF